MGEYIQRMCEGHVQELGRRGIAAEGEKPQPLQFCPEGVVWSARVSACHPSLHQPPVPSDKWFQLLLWLTQQDDMAIIRLWGDRSIPGRSERFARSFRLRKRARSISFDADGQRAVFAQSAPVSWAPASQHGRCFCVEHVGTKPLPHLAQPCTAPISLSESGSGQPIWWRHTHQESAPPHSSGHWALAVIQPPGTCCIDGAQAWSTRPEVICLG